MTTRTITTEATGRSETMPELATVEVAAIGRRDSAAAAREVARDRTASIRDSLTTLSTDQIQTVDLQVRDSSNVFEPEFDAAFQAEERLHVECVPEAAEAVVVEAMDAGGTVQTVEFHLHKHVRRQLQNRALVAAMEHARKKS